MPLVFRPEAEAELLEAQAWYETRAPDLGFEFARAVDAAAKQVARWEQRLHNSRRSTGSGTASKPNWPRRRGGDSLYEPG